MSRHSINKYQSLLGYYVKASLTQWDQTGSHILYSQFTCHESPLVAHHPCCTWRWYTPLPSRNSVLCELVFQKLDLCFRPWDRPRRLLRQWASWSLRLVTGGCNTETSWPLWESNPRFTPITASDDRTICFRALFLSFDSWMGSGAEGGVVGIFSTEEENETPKTVIPCVTPVGISRTRTRTQRPWFSVWDYCEILNPDESRNSSYSNKSYRALPQNPLVFLSLVYFVPNKKSHLPKLGLYKVYP